MAEQEPRQSAAETPGAAPEAAQGAASSAGPEAAQAAAPAEAASAPGATETGPGEATAQAAAAWEPFDAVLQAFGAERGVGVGTFWSDGGADVEGRFAGWSNTCGWRCTLQLVRAPEENVVVLVAQGPPLPGGRPRVMVLGAFPPDFERDTLRAALEVGYGIGETWGPAEEPPEPAPAAAPDAGPAPAS